MIDMRKYRFQIENWRSLNNDIIGAPEKMWYHKDSKKQSWLSNETGNPRYSTAPLVSIYTFLSVWFLLGKKSEFKKIIKLNSNTKEHTQHRSHKWNGNCENKKSETAVWKWLLNF